ncbi:phosphonate C-P lyase system protein PhnH [Falsihalocynthiibacter sp. SS001]|uniref:phosphonate C-P lyase system protein PhnH n=1 Tax=Falsihalocynthiibacter sp. SS001 TaxID=3349698 RepID=UPI0036D3F51F
MGVVDLGGGFTRIPQQSALGFRSAMTAMARPGEIQTVSGANGPAPLSIAASVLLLTLCDADTSVFIGEAHDTEAVRAWITFHTSAPFTSRSEAMFAIGAWNDLGSTDEYAIGTDQYPDRSATLIVEMDQLTNTGATLSGPGIEGTARLTVPDLAFSQKNALLYPLGIDLFLTCEDRVAALPRTTKVL